MDDKDRFYSDFLDMLRKSAFGSEGRKGGILIILRAYSSLLFLYIATSAANEFVDRVTVRRHSIFSTCLP